MVRITDVAPKYTKSFAHAVIAPLGTKAELATPDGLFNSLLEDTKRLGSVVIVTDGTAGAGHALVMATGTDYDSLWAGLGVTGDITVTADTGTTVAWSDKKPKLLKRKLGSLDFPIVKQSDLADGDKPVNNFIQSGKRFGACVIVALTAGGYAVAIAGGKAPEDKWYKIDGTVLLTPSAEVVVTAPFDKKPKVSNSTVTAIPFPVVLTATLSSATSAVNADDGISSGKRHGSMVVEQTAAGLPILRVAAGIAPTDKWLQLLGDDTTGAITPA